MTWEQVSRQTAQCCRVLWDAGFEAYPVGGCVRDMLLGRVPGDWDVSTSALPEQVTALFGRVIQTGVKHGTVTVLLDAEAIEVTTFRGESGYSDGRHPDEVRFGVGLEQDLARRDFTINAMALASDGRIIDLFGGQDDLARKEIRCVGQPERRFREDALRMFRAIRFTAQLGFALSEDTQQAIRSCAALAQKIAAERVQAEIEKTLCSDRAELAAQFFSCGLMTLWASGAPGKASGLSLLPDEAVLRWGGLCARLMEKGCIRTPEAFLRGLKLDGQTVRSCAEGWELYSSGMPETAVQWRRALAQYTQQGCRTAAAMAGGRSLKELEEVLAQNPCVRTEQLALSGGMLLEMGLQGAQIGGAQRRLLEHVLNCPEDNNEEILRRKLQELGLF